MSTKSYAWLIVCLGTFTVAWGGNQFTSMIVYYREQDTFNNLFVDSMLAIYAVGVAASLLISGAVSDRIGRKKIMVPAPMVALVASVLIALGEETEFLMALGRFVAGIALGAAMTAGGSWIKELSDVNGAKRASMAMTAGLAAGPVTAGMLAQWAVLPGQLIYLIHVMLSVAIIPLLMRVPETMTTPGARKFWPRLHLRFLGVVAPVAPWVFGTAFTAQTILTSRVAPSLDAPVAFTGMISLITMGAGFIIQQFASRWKHQPTIAMSLAIAGMLIATIVSTNPTMGGVIGASVVLGMAYGMALFTGLSETQHIAGEGELGSLTGVFYCGAYVGMFFPALLTFLGDYFTYPQMLSFGVFMAIVCLVVATIGARKL